MSETGDRCPECGVSLTGQIEALVAERRATVQRVKDRIARWPKDAAVRDFLAILDEVSK
jgi:hypothetical protein